MILVLLDSVPHTYSFHFNILQVLGLLICKGVFQLLLNSARRPLMARILIFPIFMIIPEYDGHSVYSYGIISVALAHGDLGGRITGYFRLT